MPTNKDQAPEQPSGYDPAKLYVWVKALESKVNNLVREMELLKNNTIKKTEEMKKDQKIMADDVLAVKSEQQKVLEKMDLIIKELKQTAGIEELMVIKKYMDYWNPLNFVTQKDLDRAINARLALLKDGSKSEIKEKK
jgi:predicted RND superfamily exporter protein